MTKHTGVGQVGNLKKHSESTQSKQTARNSHEHIDDHVFVPEGDTPFNCMVCSKCGEQASKHIRFDKDPIADLFNMVYMWGRIGVRVTETAPAFRAGVGLLFNEFADYCHQYYTGCQIDDKGDWEYNYKNEVVHMIDPFLNSMRVSAVGDKAVSQDKPSKIAPSKEDNK